MYETQIEKRAKKVLMEGLLKPDERNLTLFAKMLTFTAIVSCVAFSAGFSASWAMSNQLTGVQAEQCKRTAKVYHTDN